MFTQTFAEKKRGMGREKQKEKKAQKNTLYYAMQLVPSLAFPLSQFRSAFSFKCCLGAITSSGALPPDEILVTDASLRVFAGIVLAN